MSDSIVNDTTPLLAGSPHVANGTANSKKKLSKRERLMNLTVGQSVVSLVLLAGLTFISIYFLLKYNLPKDVPEEQKPWLKFPRTVEDVQHLSIILTVYIKQHYYEVLTCFMVTYIGMQSFAIPGSVMLSLLGGALFKLWRGVLIVSFCATTGSTFCYFISFYLGHPIVEKYLTARIEKLKEKIEAQKDDLFFYFAFLRVTPLVPNWFMNVASPHLGIPPWMFSLGTFIGVLPGTFAAVQAGATLAALASPDDFTLLTPQNIILAVVTGLCLLLPIVWHRHAEKKEAEQNGTKPATEEEEDQGHSTV